MCGGVVCTDVAAAYPYTAEKFKSGQTSLSAAIIVHPIVVEAEIERTAAVHGVDEKVIVTICHSFEARVRSYQLVAEAFGLATARPV